MPQEKYSICFTIHYRGEVYQIQIHEGQYPSLMALISGHLAIMGFGICSGMGSCGTCLAQIADSPEARRRSVLACDIALNDDLANKDVFVPDSDRGSGYAW